MSPREYITQELLEINSSLAGIEQYPIYQVPAGYFENLAGEIMKKVRTLDVTTAQEELALISPMLSTLSKEGPYSIPTGYFQSVEHRLPEIISTDKDQTVEEELESLSPLLLELKGKTTYSVPENYFGRINEPNKVAARRQKAKLFSIASRKWVRYAAAAIVVGLVATIGFKFLNRKETSDSTDKSFAWVEKNLKKVSTDDINAFVESINTEAADIVKTGTKDEIRNLLKDVTDKEIQEFLNDMQAAESEPGDDLILN